MAEQRIHLGNFPEGLVLRGADQLEFSPKALRGGENMDLSECLKTRDGCSVVSSGSLPVGTVRALRQFRSPTTQESKILAQVDWLPTPFVAQGDLGIQVDQHSAAWDPVHGRMFVLAGTGLGGVWYWIPNSTTGTWTQVPSSNQLGSLYMASVVYDPVGQRIIVWGGSVITGSVYNGVWTFDCNTLTFSQHTNTGTAPPARFSGCPACFRPNGGAGEFCVFASTTTNPSSTFAMYRLDLSTFAWSKGTDTPFAMGSSSCRSAAYYATNDAIYIYGLGSGYKEIWRYSFATTVWTQLTSNNAIPSSCRPLEVYPEAFVIGTKIYFVWGEIDDNTGFAPIDHSGSIYDISNDTWSLIQIQGAPVGRFFHSACLTDGGHVLMYGGRLSDPGGPGQSGFWDLTPPSAPITQHDALFVSSDYLPTDSATFSQIYDLGAGAGTVSFGPLNDRVVITEGINKPPLVYPGAESNDASDWAVPKAVLATQDGTNYYDITPQVCDADPDTIASAGDITPAGHIDICCDMPEVEGFYFEVKTPNTGGGVAPIYNQQKAIAQESEINQYDLKATIDHWKQDSGATGHFENASNTALTLGAGNNCPDVIVGTKIAFSDATTAYISAVSGDGSGVGAVTITATKATTTVSAIYGTDVQNSALTVACTYGQAKMTTFNQTLSSYATFAAGTAICQVIKGSDVTASLTSIQVTFKTSNFSIPGLSSLIGQWYCAKVTIAPRSGSTANATTSPTEITFLNGISGFSIDSYYSPSGITSDVIPFTMNAGTDYLIKFDIMVDATPNGFLPPSQAQVALNPGPGHGGYYICQGPAASVQNPTVLNDYTASGQIAGVTLIQGTGTSGAPNVIEVATTNSLSRISVAGVSTNGIQVSGATPSDSALWLALSFDGQATFNVWYSSAWQTIVQQSGGNWQYWTGSAFTNASTNNVYQALRQAMAVAANQMNMAVLAAITASQLQSTGGVIPNVTQTLDLAIGMKAGAQNALPTVTAWSAGVNMASISAMTGYKSGGYSAGTGWTDGTAVDGVNLAQTGIISYNGGTFAAGYSVLDSVPGYWYRFSMNGTSSGTSISRILYKAPCQPLANIGDGQPSLPSGFIFVDTSKNNTLDFTEQVEDNVLTNFSVAPLPMGTDDYLYVGFKYQFNAVEMTPTDKNQSTVATLSAEYWTGSEWAALTIIDGTAGADGKTLSGAGRITWDIPADWKMNIPFDKFLSRAYWVRFKVSAALSSTTEIAECRVYSVPTALKKHRCVEVASDRVFLAGRPDNENQVDISGELAEYLFNGDQSWSGNVGGQDAITALTAAYDRLFVWKPSTVHMWNGKGFVGAEAAGRTPINGQCVVKAVANGKAGLFFLNRSGAYAIHGLQADNTYSTAAISELSLQLNFWDANANPRLDLNYLHLACGEFWPKKGWIVWSVPMIIGDATEQTTNNVLMVWDLILGCWYPLFQMPFGVASLCAAYTYNANAPQKLGDTILLAGDYQGRILRLFDPAATDDAGTAIDWYAETGWLHDGDATDEKDLASVWLFGTASGDVTLTTTSRSNYRQELIEPTASTRVFSDLSGVSDQLGMAKEVFAQRERGNYFKHRISGSGPAQIYGLTMELLGERNQ